MTGRSELLLLDTNIVIHLIRDNEIGRRVDAMFQIRHRTDRPLISVVTVGECLSLARQFRWGAEKIAIMEGLLSEFVTVPIDSRPVLDHFGSFITGCDRPAAFSVTTICGSRPRLLRRVPI